MSDKDKNMSDKDKNSRLREVREWRQLFPASMVKEAAQAKVQRQIKSFHNYGWMCYAEMSVAVPSRRNPARMLMKKYNVRISGYPHTYDDHWSLREMYCDCPEGDPGLPCIHKAAVMTRLEKENGPFVVEETDWEYRRRRQREAMAAEKKRIDALKAGFDQKEIPALTFFSDRKDSEGIIIWDIHSLLEGFTTTAYEIARARELDANDLVRTRCTQQVSRDGTRYLVAACEATNIVSMTWRPASEASITGARGRVVRRSNPPDMAADAQSEDVHSLDACELLMFREIWDYSDTQIEDGNDMTDEVALKFFSSMNESPGAVPAKTVNEDTRVKSAELQPRIIIEDGEANLSFRAGLKGQRMFVLRNLEDFVRAASRRMKFDLSKTKQLDFSKYDFTEEARPLYDFITRRVGEINEANEKIELRNSFRSVRTLSVKSMLELKGSLLDNFYDIADGRECLYSDKTNNIKDVIIKIGYQPLHFSLKAQRLSDARNTFAGVSVHGLIPVLIDGSSYEYVLNSSYLSRVTPEEMRRLRPFRDVADSSGYFRFQVGRDHLQEFYYRIVPRLIDSPGITFDDDAEDEARVYLPPEPVFTFYLDLYPFSEEHPEKSVLTLRGDIAYGEKKYTLGDPPEEGEYHDSTQEERVEQAVMTFFSIHHKEQHYYGKVMSEDELYDFLRDGLAVLEKYGTVKGSDAFKSVKLRPVPQIRLGISVESGIMDLSLTSDELDSDQLLEIYRSYHQRKRWHKLSSGDYLDLSDDDQMRELDDLFNGMDLNTEDAIKDKLALPVYRALYLDKLLEKHEEITSSRNRVYRALVRNFKTVQDSEAEPPASLENVLRPYQSYGYKWLMTLAGSGFGGILADEMGLGKTLQMISVLLSVKETHPEDAGTSLIVCPASLVYNWQEEFARFAPALNVKPLTGGAAARRAALEEFSDTDAYIISYDLLKRHIAKMETLSFDFVVLDEAQYIKNAGAAAAKSVKVLHAAHRFALTGTPIENRLSELWSIFDFLMPGFLYSQREFQRRFETPIVKEKDETVSGKLYAMTAPFLLRRKKADVLKDLPPKLEEVRYVQLSGEQQKLYDAQVLRLKNTIDTDEKIKVLAELTKIREICCDPSLLFEDYHGDSVKRTACMDLIKSAIDGGHRMLLFSQFTSMLALLESDLREEGIEYYILTGATSKEKRIQLVHAFNEGEVPVFLISLKAGGTGLNLTGADVVIHYDPWWNIAAQNQATDRTHRIGQTRQVTVYKMIIKDTIEERILELQETKKDLADSMTEGRGNPLASLSRDELLALLD